MSEKLEESGVFVFGNKNAYFLEIEDGKIKISFHPWSYHLIRTLKPQLHKRKAF
jgi:hypothetical protein